jgi:hypothetical protein
VRRSVRSVSLASGSGGRNAAGVMPVKRNKGDTPARRGTSYDVARLAGVSQSAVSRCFRPGGSVSPDARKRILAAAEELGYRPNAIARG